MSLLNHPNLVSCYCSFVSGPARRGLPFCAAHPHVALPQNLWVIMPYFAGGSVLNIMKWGHPQARLPPPVPAPLAAFQPPASPSRGWTRRPSRPSWSRC